MSSPIQPQPETQPGLAPSPAPSHVDLDKTCSKTDPGKETGPLLNSPSAQDDSTDQTQTPNGCLSDQNANQASAGSGLTAIRNRNASGPALSDQVLVPPEPASKERVPNEEELKMLNGGLDAGVDGGEEWGEEDEDEKVRNIALSRRKNPTNPSKNKLNPRSPSTPSSRSEARSDAFLLCSRIVSLVSTSIIPQPFELWG